MRIFLAGASGAIGLPLTRMLVAVGHEVTGMTRTPERASGIVAAGARPVVVDLFDTDGLRRAVGDARPEVVIHQVTDLAVPTAKDLTDEQLARNARVREEGTPNLIEAAVAAGARRVIAQSIAWLFPPGPEPHLEDEPIEPPDPATMSATRRAVVVLERLITADRRFEGVVLRYGRLYGPGTWERSRPEPPTVHVDDAARAALLAVDHGEPGIYHVVDDGGPVSNEKAAGLLGWRPGHARREEVRDR